MPAVLVVGAANAFPVVFIVARIDADNLSGFRVPVSSKGYKV